jgi:hypothetical protein
MAVLSPADQSAASRVTDSQAANWLAYAIAGDHVTGLTDMIEELLTYEQINELIESAWAQADYESGDPPQDRAGRSFTIHIGTSSGAGYILNNGDIFLTQDDGDIMVGHISSKYGDVTVTAANGGILAGAAADPEHIFGASIKLCAKGSIGNASAQLITEQQANRPVLIGNVIQPNEAGGVYDPVIVERVTTTGADGIEHYTYALKVIVHYDWIRATDPAEAVRLDASSQTGSIYIRELTGSIGLGILEAAQNINISAPQSILDMRTDTEKSGGNRNVTAATANLTAENGTIGQILTIIDPVTSIPRYDEQRISISISGSANMYAFGDIALDAASNLIITADSLTGTLYIDAEGNAVISNTSTSGSGTGDMTVGLIRAGGLVSLTSEGSIAEGGRLGKEANISADSIELRAKNGGIGSENDSFDVNTAAGLLGAGTITAYAKELHLNETSGDLVLGHIEAAGGGTGNVSITAPGNIIGANSGGKLITDAAEALKKAFEAENTADQAQARADVLEAYAAWKEQEYAKAAESVSALENRVKAVTEDTGISEQQRALLLDRLNKQLAAARTVADELNKQLGAARAEADTAKADADKLASDALALKAAAEAALQAAASAPCTIIADGYLTLGAGESIGSGLNYITFSANGALTGIAGMDSDDGIYLAGTGNVLLNSLTAGREVSLISLGNIRQADALQSGGSMVYVPADRTPGQPCVRAEITGLYSLIGSVGTISAPLRLNTGSIAGIGRTGFYVINDRGLIIGSVYTEGNAFISAAGSIAADPSETEGCANVTAEDLTLIARGNIGTGEHPLIINVHGSLSASGRDMYLDSIADLIIRSIRGRDVDIQSDGTVMGSGLHARNLIIKAYGDVGAKDDPLVIYVPGNVDIISVFGLIYYINRYTHGDHKQGSDQGGSDVITPGMPRTGSAHDVNGLALIFLALVMISVMQVRRRVRKKRY